MSFNKVPTIDQEKTPTNRTQLVGTAVLLGVVATLWGYEYGTYNQTEYVLAAERVLESGFLSSDFFTNTTTSFGPRSYFIQLVALLATVAPLPAVFFCLALAANATTSAITALAGNNLFGLPLAGALAACMVLGLDTLRLGEAAYLTMPYLLQATLAIPLALCAIWAALRGHVVAAALGSGIASLLHPVIGGGVGGVVLAASTTTIILTGIRHAASNSRSRMAIGSLILGWLVFISLFSLNVLPYASMERIDSSELSHILVIFRAPHHYLPSSFPRRDYLYAASFLAATLLAWHTLSRHSAALREVWRVAQLMIGVVLLGCLGGYLFVEVTPTRLWISAQTFRFLFIVNWLGLIGAAAVIATRLQSEEHRSDYAGSVACLLAMMSPITMLATQWVNSVRSAKASALLTRSFPRFRVAAVAAISGFAVLTGYANARFLFLLAIGLLAFAGPVVLWNMLATGLFAAALIAGLLWGRFGFPRPHFTLAGASDYADGLSAAVRQSTPADAVILTPPSFGMLRLLAHRAIVVDFKNIPFRDRDMRDWYQRILYCYGPVAATGYAAPDSMDANYRKISDARLKAIHQRYSASFALLYVETVTEYPVVAAAEHLKLVHLVDGSQGRVRQH